MENRPSEKSVISTGDRVELPNSTLVRVIFQQLSEEWKKDLTQHFETLTANFIETVGDLRDSSDESWKKWNLPTKLEDALKRAIRLSSSGTKKRSFEDFNPEIRVRAEGVDLSDALTIRRNEKCKQIASYVITNTVVLWRSPPMSGKSSIGTLLVEYIHRTYSDIEVTLVNLLDWLSSDERKRQPPPKKQNKSNNPKQNTVAQKQKPKQNTLTQQKKDSVELVLDSFESWWLKQYGTTLNTSLKTKMNNKKRFFILDEAQCLYPLGSKHNFWVLLKRLQGNPGPDSHVSILLLSMYGEAPTEHNITSWSTPIEIRAVLDLSYIRFSKNELDCFVAMWNKLYPILSIGPGTRERLWIATLGHIGFIRLAVESMRDHFLDRVKLGQIDWTDSVSAKYLLSKFFYNKLTDCRAVPKEWSLSLCDRELLDMILLSPESKIARQSTQWTSERKNSLRTLVKRGIIFSDEQNLMISAPLLKMLLVRQLHGASQPSFTEKDIDDFLIETIKRMSTRQLQNTFSVGQDTYIMERQWQMEFYRAASSVLDQKHFISPDVGSDGWIDFYVDDDFEWGIELLREGYKIGQHASRFEEGGAYDSLNLKKAVVLDFRRASKEPQMRNYCVPIWYIMYSNDFQQVTIKREKKDPLTFCLVGDK